MSDISINYSEVESKINAINRKLSAKQAEMENIYARAVSCISGCKGEEADALRDLQEAEKSLMKETCRTLDKLAQSIQFAATQLRIMDTGIAAKLSFMKKESK